MGGLLFVSCTNNISPLLVFFVCCGKEGKESSDKEEEISLTVDYHEVYPPILANTPPPLLSLAQSLVPPCSEASEMPVKSSKISN